MALITYSNYNIKNVTINGIKQAIHYDLQRISIYYVGEKNHQYDFQLEVPNVVSYGFQKNNFQYSSVNSYTLPLVIDNDRSNE